MTIGTKRLIAIIAGVLAVFCAVFTFMACGEPEGECVLGLESLYESGELTENDLKNIAALRVGYVAIGNYPEQEIEEFEKIEFEPTVPAPLDEETAKKIEQSFRYYKKIQDEYGYEMKRFQITDYYGKYNGYEIVNILYSDPTALMWCGMPYVVANIYIGTIGGGNDILAWKASENLKE